MATALAQPIEIWRKRVGVEPTIAAERRRSTVLKTAMVTGPPALPCCDLRVVILKEAAKWRWIRVEITLCPLAAASLLRFALFSNEFRSHPVRLPNENRWTDDRSPQNRAFFVRRYERNYCDE